MSFQMKNNNGSLFRNRKEKDTQPDYTGKCIVNGETMRMAAWVKNGQRGSFLSIVFSEPRESNRGGYRDNPADDRRDSRRDDRRDYRRDERSDDRDHDRRPPADDRYRREPNDDRDSGRLPDDDNLPF